MKFKNIFIGHFIECFQRFHELKTVELLICEDNEFKNKIVIEYALKNNIQILKINSAQEITNFVIQNNLNIDLVIVASFGKILKNEFINKCKKIINIHCGNLMICRGRHALPIAIINKHKYASVTAHIIDSNQIDAGEIVYEFTFAINYNQSYQYNAQIMYDSMPLMIEYICKHYNYEKNTIATYPWDVANSIYHKPLDSELCNKIINCNCLKDLFK